MTISDMKATAFTNAEGDLVHEREYTSPSGNTTTKTTNLSKMLNPGKRTTNDIEILLHEARQAEREGVDNPAYPASEGVRSDAESRIMSEGLTPAWEGHTTADYL